MKIKRVLSSLVAASVLMFSTLTVCAAPSTTVTTATNVTAAIKTETKGITVAASTQDKVDSAIAAVKTITAANTTAEVASVVEITAGSDAVKLDNGNYEVTVEVPSVKANETIIVLHFTNGKWEQLSNVKVADGKVTFQTSSFSPFAFIKVAGKTSPKTGETIPYAAVVLVIGAVAAAVCGKKFFA